MFITELAVETVTVTVPLRLFFFLCIHRMYPPRLDVAMSFSDGERRSGPGCLSSPAPPAP